MTFNKDDAYTSDEKVEKLSRYFNIHYISCIGSLIYLFSTRVDLIFAVHKLAKFSSNNGKLHYKGLVHLLRYTRENKTLGLKYYADMKYAPLSNLLIYVSINNENHFMALSDYIWKNCPDTVISTDAASTL